MAAKIVRTAVEKRLDRNTRNYAKAWRPMRMIGFAPSGAGIIHPNDSLYKIRCPDGKIVNVNTTGCFGVKTTGGGVSHLSVVKKTAGKTRYAKIRRRGGKTFDFDNITAMLERRSALHLKIIRGQATEAEAWHLMAMNKKIQDGWPQLWAAVREKDIARTRCEMGRSKAKAGQG
jgi:hypothetical protein